MLPVVDLDIPSELYEKYPITGNGLSSNDIKKNSDKKKKLTRAEKKLNKTNEEKKRNKIMKAKQKGIAHFSDKGKSETILTKVFIKSIKTYFESQNIRFEKNSPEFVRRIVERIIIEFFASSYKLMVLLNKKVLLQKYSEELLNNFYDKFNIDRYEAEQYEDVREKIFDNTIRAFALKENVTSLSSKVYDDIRTFIINVTVTIIRRSFNIVSLLEKKTIVESAVYDAAKEMNFFGI